MAFIYKKVDQKNPGKWRWWAAVSIRGEEVRVSLRLGADGNKRLAKARADALQYEASNGLLSDATRAWLGPSAERVDAAIRGTRSSAWPSWSAAADAFLEADPGRGDSVRHRALACRRFASWADNEGAPISGDPSPLLARWLSHLVSSGLMSSRSARAASAPYASKMLNWMAATSGALARVNHSVVRDATPKPEPLRLKLPSHADDLAVLDTFPEGPCRAILTMVRGMACRPTEAMALDWGSVTLDAGAEAVTFRHTKDQKMTGTQGRTVPILWTWVADYLRAHRRDSGPVCPSPTGRRWSAQTYLVAVFRRDAQLTPCPSYRLKQAQKMGLMQMLQAGVPAHVVAHWTGHTLSVQEKHYMTDRAYLPAGNDYGKYGVLTEYGRKAVEMNRRRG